MKTLLLATALFATSWLGGCATSKNITQAQLTNVPSIRTVAMVADEGNSADMDTKVRTALMNRNLTVSASLPTGTRQSDAVDAIVGYLDVWRWDLAMYLKSVTMGVYDARTGNLLVTAEWHDSAWHGFRDSQAIVQELVDDMFGKLKAGTSPAATQDGVANTADTH